MKKLFLSIMLSLVGIAMTNAQVYTKPCSDKALMKTAQKWVKKGEWRNGLKGAKPHKSVNAVEFYTQYQKNREQWDAMFKWLAENDLQTVPGGKHPIEGTNLTVSVEDSENAPLEKRTSESHYHHIDFQFVVKGTERFGILDHETSTPNTKYKPDVIRYAYDKDKTLFHDSNPKEFFLFFPDDWHIAKIATDKEDQKIRVVVIKLDYVE